MRWRPEFGLGIPVIDDQHRQLVRLITLLQDAVRTGAVGSAVADVLRSLVDYTQYHFREEERIMQQIRYPDLEAHRAQQAGLIAQITDILLRLRRGEEVGEPEMIEFLVRWLGEHILQDDRKIGEAFQAARRQALPPDG